MRVISTGYFPLHEFDHNSAGAWLDGLVVVGGE
jgi:hypothetical protein